MLLSALEKRDRSSLDAVLLPGGMPGASNIAASAGAGALIEELHAAGKLVCAICAAPAVALAPLGILAGRRFTCYPGTEKQAVQIQKDAEWSEDPVVIDGNLITSRGPGTAGAWALAIAGKLAGEGTAKKIAEAALFQKPA
jgi:4-methyl-5(b-hydroxyethyl)-thiazole monophosphate biosynthesis